MARVEELEPRTRATSSVRARGCLLGLACGDALGATVELEPRGTFEPLTDIVGGGRHDLPAGAWTDDTSLALCLAESLLARGEHDPVDQLRRYVRWLREGHLSSTGRCFDVGDTTVTALERFEWTGNPASGPTDALSAGNGSIMRLAPVAIFYHPDRDAVERYAQESSRTTHGAAEAVEACRILGGILHALLDGAPKEEAVRSVRAAVDASPRLRGIASAAYVGRPMSEIRGSGYVVDSLEAALWCFVGTDSFADAVLAAANLGDDADTTAAVCGQLAGACYGVDAIPMRWLERLVMRGTMERWADRLAEGPGA